MTEDQVREKLKELTGIETGQLTTFNALGFTQYDMQRNIDLPKNALHMKPDGWYLPKDKNVCIIAETKSDQITNLKAHAKQLIQYIKICKTKYRNVIGILFNGVEAVIYKNFEIFNDSKTLDKALKNKEYYLNLANENHIDKRKIWNNTAKINDLLHHKFMLSDVKHRMIYTACVLVAERYGAQFNFTDSIKTIKTKTLEVLSKEIKKESGNKENKLIELYHVFERIDLQDNLFKLNEYTCELITCINEIAQSINSNEWNGEDVMAIFFNEFTRYLAKADMGQIFTPEHIASFMYRITNTHYNDKVLDACCGSGTFLVKAMSNMIQEVGGESTNKAKEIKQNHLFGIEKSKELYALACANMLIHKDGKSNINFDDTNSEESKEWIRQKHITKVLMNPPYERQYLPLKIIKNVLDNVEIGATCAFLLPNTKLRIMNKEARQILNNHRLTHIIKLPDIFGQMASTGEVSIFMFTAHEPQNNEKIFGCWIKNDGLETVKNQGRHDVNNLWANELEDYWVNVVKTKIDEKYKTIRWISPTDSLQYPDEFKQEEIYEEDFYTTVLDRVLFENPDISKQLEFKSKNNPDGLTKQDWIIYFFKKIGGEF